MIDKRAFMLGFFTDACLNKTGKATTKEINMLCEVAGMSPMTMEEGGEMGKFLEWLGDVMERRGIEKGFLDQNGKAK